MSLDLRNLFDRFRARAGNSLSAATAPMLAAIRKQSPETASAISTLQSQIEDLSRKLSELAVASVTNMGVLAADGKPIAKIGAWDKWRGAAFDRLYIGDGATTDPESAVIIADESGVGINGATFALTKNGVTTELNNALSASLVYPLVSENNTYGNMVSLRVGELYSDLILRASNGTEMAFLSATEGTSSAGLILRSQDVSSDKNQVYITSSLGIVFEKSHTLYFDNSSSGSLFSASAGSSAGYLTIYYRGAARKIQIFNP